MTKRWNNFLFSTAYLWLSSLSDVKSMKSVGSGITRRFGKISIPSEGFLVGEKYSSAASTVVDLVGWLLICEAVSADWSISRSENLFDIAGKMNRERNEYRYKTNAHTRVTIFFSNNYLMQVRVDVKRQSTPLFPFLALFPRWHSFRCYRQLTVHFDQ